jgi:hypothetical protein
MKISGRRSRHRVRGIGSSLVGESSGSESAPMKMAWDWACRRYSPPITVVCGAANAARRSLHGGLYTCQRARCLQRRDACLLPSRRGESGFPTVFSQKRRVSGAGGWGTVIPHPDSRDTARRYGPDDGGAPPDPVLPELEALTVDLRWGIPIPQRKSTSGSALAALPSNNSEIMCLPGRRRWLANRQQRNTTRS